MKKYKSKLSSDAVMLRDTVSQPLMTGWDIEVYVFKWSIPKLALMLGVCTRTIHRYRKLDSLPRSIQLALYQIDLTNGNVRGVSITGEMLKRKMLVLNWTTKELSLAIGRSNFAIAEYLRNPFKSIPLDVAIAVDYLITNKELLIKYKKEK